VCALCNLFPQAFRFTVFPAKKRILSMGLSLLMTLSFLGFWAVFSHFRKSARLRDLCTSIARRIAQRASLRTLTVVGLLGSAGVAGIVDLVRVQGLAGSVIAGTLGLFLLVLGTAGAVCTFLARNCLVTLPPDDATRSVSVPPRITPKLGWTLAVLALAAAALLVSNVMLPTPAGHLALVLLILGVGAGVFGYQFDRQAESPRQPGILRVSPRGWISIGLLALATGIQAVDQAWVWASGEAFGTHQVAEATAEKNLAEARAALVKMEAELRSLPTYGRSWDDLRGSNDQGTASHESGDARKLQAELDDLRLQVARLGAGPNSSGPALLSYSPVPSTVDLATWKWRSTLPRSYDRAEPDRDYQTMLESQVGQLRAKVTQMETEANKAKSARATVSPMNVDFSTWTWNGRVRQDTSVAGHDSPSSGTGRYRMP
jgi:hypothetical protein